MWGVGCYHEISPSRNAGSDCRVMVAIDYSTRSKEGYDAFCRAHCLAKRQAKSRSSQFLLIFDV